MGDQRDVLTIKTTMGLSTLAQSVLLRLYAIADDSGVAHGIGRLTLNPIGRDDAERALVELARAGLVDIFRDYSKHTKRFGVSSVTLLWRLP